MSSSLSRACAALSRFGRRPLCSPVTSARGPKRPEAGFDDTKYYPATDTPITDRQFVDGDGVFCVVSDDRGRQCDGLANFRGDEETGGREELQLRRCDVAFDAEDARHVVHRQPEHVQRIRS